MLQIEDDHPNKIIDSEIVKTTHSIILKIKEKIKIIKEKQPKLVYNHMNFKQGRSYLFLKNYFQIKDKIKFHQTKSLVIIS